MVKRFWFKIIFVLFLLLPIYGISQVVVSTAWNDNTRDGVNSNESILKPSNIGSLQKLWTNPLDGKSSTQPLFIPASLNGTANDMVIATTWNNTVYALNALTGATIWSTNFGSTWTTGYTGVLYSTPIGIISAPVVDTSTGYLYVITVNGTPTYTLRKLAISTGAQSLSVNISGSYPGTGCGSDHTSGGNVLFFATWELQRTPLTLANGNIYFGFGAGNEPFQWHGWVFSYDTATLTQQNVLLLTSTGCGAGVWSPITVDTFGNLYFLTGNGDYNGTTNFSQSLIKTNGSLVIQGSFTPSNNASTTAVDADLASGKPMLLTISGTLYITWSSKDGRGWLIDTTNLCGLQGSGGCTASQVFTVFSLTAGGDTGTFGGGPFMNSIVYFPILGQDMFGLTLLSGSFGSSFNTSSTFGQVWASGTSNNGTNPILWALTVDDDPGGTPQEVTLRAFNPSTLAEYWNSGRLGYMAKFSAPTIANGQIYVSTWDNGIKAFNLVNSTFINGSGTFSGNVFGQ